MPRSVAALEPVAVRLARSLAEDLASVKEFDFYSMFAMRLTARFFGELVGMTGPEELEVAQVISELQPMFLLQKSVSELNAADTAARGYISLMERVADRSRVPGQNTLLDTMAKELAAIEVSSDPERGGMVPQSLGLMLASNLLDGFHTAAVAASSTLYLLLKHPEAKVAVREDPSLARAAVHESLRLLSPLTVTQRFALKDLEYTGVRIPEGTPIVMLWAVGNRDPAAFSDPDEFRLTRHHRHETTFGGGIHVCPGRYVADMIAQVTIRELCRERWDLVFGSGDVEWIDRSIMCQVGVLPVVLRDTGGATA